MSLCLISTSRSVPSSLFRRSFLSFNLRLLSSNQYNNDIIQAEKQQLKINPTTPKQSPRFRRYHYYLFSIATGALIGTIYALRHVRKHEGNLPEYVTNVELLERKAIETRPVPPPVTKHITFDALPRKNFPFNITLYQYVTCPFCCKVRAYLNYNRIPYDIVEVNSVTHTETKWSLYNKVPIVVIENEQIQLNDSSMIISAIESYLRQPTKKIKNIINLYEAIVQKDQKGNISFNYPNRYFIFEPAVLDRLETTNEEQQSTNNKQSKSFFAKLFSRSTAQSNNDSKIVQSENTDKKKSDEENEFERQWREWVDNKFVHVISPNIYCTVGQSISTFRWFSKAGDWEEIFPWYQRWIIVYLGAIVMRGVAIHLKKKYNLNDNVRISLYECGDEWVNTIGDKDFHGGFEPNLADLNVYGILTAIEGSDAFQDLMNNTKIQPWFARMKNLVEPHRIDTSIMTILECTGCTLIAYGIPFSMFVFTMAHHPFRIIIAMTSAFFWLISMLLSSLLWFTVVPLRNQLAFAVPFAVLFQEIFRYLFYLVIKKAEFSLQTVQMQELTAKGMTFDRFAVAYAAGYGFGFISGTFSIVNVLSDMTGPGTIGIFGHSQDFFIATAFLTLAIILLNTFWNIIFFTSLDKGGIHRYLGPALVVITHMLFSCLTLLNRATKPTYSIPIINGCVILCGMIVYALFLRGFNIRQRLSRQ
ncbi:unnamed protein product [Rotaria socialis]|uniref:Prostaglandin E synthase 2 n=1 Tax=Rotaria socialis TaxID=392032 RepID=A0A818L7W3_9BILA|nr:unnamed protein product [Rotaria socialis]CAF4356831.1 unnamed protein product [Rotaria socialis]